MTQAGKITSFYSYKGGVGRTMALTNLAFIAAMNGKKVLLMDWDLEAPGLGRYFQFLHGQATRKEMQHRPGVLDVLHGWSENFTQHADQFDAYAQQIKDGSIFSSCVQSLIDDDAKSLLGMSGRLDLISAGAPQDAQGRSFAEKLAAFSWQDFFDLHAGGFLLQELQAWARNQYDEILIDSRTGLADAAGVCTMQLPDQVALCFIYNRQNIEGIAQVGQQIRQQLPQAKLFLLPMRTPPVESDQYSNARAIAETQFFRKLDISREEIQQQMRSHALPEFLHLPCMESLALLEVDDCKFDSLSLRYHLLSQVLLDKTLAMPEFSRESLQQIQLRAKAKFVDIEHLKNLEKENTSRSIRELRHLSFSACDEDNSDFINPEYLLALSKAIKEIPSDQFLSRCDAHFKEKALYQILHHARELVKKAPEVWWQTFSEISKFSYNDSTAEIIFSAIKECIKEESDSILYSCLSLLYALEIIKKHPSSEILLNSLCEKLSNREFPSMYSSNWIFAIQFTATRNFIKEKDINEFSALTIIKLAIKKLHIADEEAIFEQWNLLTQIFSLTKISPFEKIKVIASIKAPHHLLFFADDSFSRCLDLLLEENNEALIVEFSENYHEAAHISGLGNIFSITEYAIKNLQSLVGFLDLLNTINIEETNKWLDHFDSFFQILSKEDIKRSVSHSIESFQKLQKIALTLGHTSLSQKLSAILSIPPISPEASA
ncbi:AAA family ATPase [Massilia sp. W12]|uniref:tyrosine-protein kinase family protein n=1 Tax=Massilia sp. W12 TaxID=3126507 RepID=UPI0030D0C569